MLATQPHHPAASGAVYATFFKTVLIPVVGKQEHHSQNFVYVTEFQFGMIFLFSYKKLPFLFARANPKTHSTSWTAISLPGS